MTAAVMYTRSRYSSSCSIVVFGGSILYLKLSLRFSVGFLLLVNKISQTRGVLMKISKSKTSTGSIIHRNTTIQTATVAPVQAIVSGRRRRWRNACRCGAEICEMRSSRRRSTRFFFVLIFHYGHCDVAVAAVAWCWRFWWLCHGMSWENPNERAWQQIWSSMQ